MQSSGTQCDTDENLKLNFLFTHKREVAILSGEHLWLVGISMLLAVAVGVPLGILLTRQPKLKVLILGSTNVIQTIPSLALFGLLLPLPWLGVRVDRLAIAALALYALLPIVRNTYTGITGISAPVREAAVAMGLTSRQLLWQVELPLASPTDLLRNSRGDRYHDRRGDDRSGNRSRRAWRAYLSRHRDGGQRSDPGRRDSGCGYGIARGLSAGQASKSCWREGIVSMLDRRAFLAGSMALLAAGCRSSRHDIVVGSKNFTEQLILGELFAQVLEHSCQTPVQRRFYLAGTYICQQAILAGRIDVYPEYTGTALAAVLKQNAAGSAEQVYEEVKREYREKFQLDVMPPLGFNNTFAMVMRGDDAKRLGISKLSQLAPDAPTMRLGVGYEFLERQDGYKGLVRAYDLQIR